MYCNALSVHITHLTPVPEFVFYAYYIVCKAL